MPRFQTIEALEHEALAVAMRGGSLGEICSILAKGPTGSDAAATQAGRDAAALDVRSRARRARVTASPVMTAWYRTHARRAHLQMIGHGA